MVWLNFLFMMKSINYRVLGGGLWDVKGRIDSGVRGSGGSLQSGYIEWWGATMDSPFYGAMSGGLNVLGRLNTVHTHTKYLIKPFLFNPQSPSWDLVFLQPAWLEAHMGKYLALSICFPFPLMFWRGFWESGIKLIDQYNTMSVSLQE